jgi:hypothetical protein
VNAPSRFGSSRGTEYSEPRIVPMFGLKKPLPQMRHASAPKAAAGFEHRHAVSQAEGRQVACFLLPTGMGLTAQPFDLAVETGVYFAGVVGAGVGHGWIEA